MSDADRIAALEQRSLELETEVAALTALVLTLIKAGGETPELEEYREAVGSSLARWAELDAAEVRRAISELLRVRPR